MAVIAGLFVSAGVLSFLGILGWQVVHYLKEGVWFPVSVVDGLEYVGFEWALNPSSWIGLHNVLNIVNLGFAIMICGWVVAGVLASIGDVLAYSAEP
jgi:hypothetical protein